MSNEGGRWLETLRAMRSAQSKCFFKRVSRGVTCSPLHCDSGKDWTSRYSLNCEEIAAIQRFKWLDAGSMLVAPAFKNLIVWQFVQQ